MSDTEDFEVDPGSAPDDEPSRDGFLWVNPNTHEILGTGIDKQPAGVSNVKLRRYFDDLGRGIEMFGEFGVEEFRKSEVRRVTAEMEVLLGLPFKECFFVCDGSGSRSSHYLAVVFRGHRGGSMWAMKNRMETTRRVGGAKPVDGNDKLFRVELPGFANGTGGTPASMSAVVYCPETNLKLPLTGKCELSVPGCRVCNPVT